jgi:hypothetical protein
VSEAQHRTECTHTICSTTSIRRERRASDRASETACIWLHNNHISNKQQATSTTTHDQRHRQTARQTEAKRTRSGGLVHTAGRAHASAGATATRCSRGEEVGERHAAFGTHAPAVLSRGDRRHRPGHGRLRRRCRCGRRRHRFGAARRLSRRRRRGRRRGRGRGRVEHRRDRRRHRRLRHSGRRGRGGLSRCRRRRLRVRADGRRRRSGRLSAHTRLRVDLRLCRCRRRRSGGRSGFCRRL